MPIRDARQIVAWSVFVLAALVVLVQAFSLYDRGKDLKSDFGVFYRTCRLLDHGGGAEVYARRDSETGWPISIPPAGLAVFQPFSRLAPGSAAATWALFNVLAAALGVVFLRRLLDPPVALWVQSIYLFLAGSAIQVGQYSALFATLWVMGAWSLAKGRDSTMAWSWPAATKLYPTLLFAVPLSFAKGWRDVAKCVATSVAAILFFAYVLPLPFYGARTIELNNSFTNEVMLDSSGRVKWMQALGSTANQGLDAVMIRYLSWYPKFHEQYTYVPTAKLDLDVVRQLGHVVRALIIGWTLFAVWKWRRTAQLESRTCVQNALAMVALWSATLYLCLPETRSRYAVYTVLAFVPLLQWATGSKLRTYCAGAVFFLVLGALPPPLDVLGVGLLGSLALWLAALHALKN